MSNGNSDRNVLFSNFDLDNRLFVPPFFFLLLFIYYYYYGMDYIEL